MALTRYVDTLTVLGDESRLRLCALLREHELRVTDLVRVTGIAQSRVSTHLGRLRDAGFVRDRRDGSQSFYALATDALPGAVKAVLDEATTETDPTLDGDRKRLAALLAEGRGHLPDFFAGEMDRHYSPGRTWQSLSAGLAAFLRLGDVLDVGSGDGAAAACIAPHCRSLTCLDASARMVEAAAERLAPHESARAIVGDAHDLPFPASSFDAIALFHTLTYAERPARVAQECARVLRPGGRLVVLCLDRHEHHPGFSPQAIRGLLCRAWLDVASCEVAAREPKKPHFVVVLAIADKPSRSASKSKRAS
jgi:SAM-dependent methyltransferase/DNA-binding transcriptional ArsR family regulator